MDTSLHPRLHALVVGIDKYPSRRIPELTGAVSDAEAIVEYLRFDLRVPEEQIVVLHNEQATRQAIVEHIQALCNRTGIRRGDPVLIYFAGHGTTTAAPADWHIGDQTISLIVPYDTETALDGAEVFNYAIPDRTFAALLHKLAEQLGEDNRGANITVIFDCCHSGSGTRSIGAQELSDSRQARGFKSEGILPELPAGLDQNIWSGMPQNRDLKVVKGFAHAGTKSHVLLAACREAESAFENSDKRRGYFTHELIRVLRSVQPDKVTYQELMQRISNLPGQTPQCEGRDVDRLLFNALVPSQRRTIYQVERHEKKDYIFVVDVGSIHGVAAGDTFAIYAARQFKPTDEPITVMKAVTVYAFATDLAYLGPLTSDQPSPLDVGTPPWFAVQLSVGSPPALRLHVEPEDDVNRCIWAAVEMVAQTHQVGGGPVITVEDSPTHANLSACVSDGDVTYIVHDPLITDLQLAKLYRTTKADARLIQPVLRAAANFFWHLHHAPSKNLLTKKVNIQVFRLEVDDNAELGDDLRLPYIAHGDNLYDRSGVVDVIADDETPYGILVRNESTVPLHVWAFYFNCSTLAIQEYYRPPAIGSNAAAPLPAKCIHQECDHSPAVKAKGYTIGELMIGYGPGGGQPYTFYIPNRGQILDVGFIKLFISTESVDLSTIVQPTPFAPTEHTTTRDLGKKKARPADGIWDTFTIAVVQHQPTSGP